MQIDLDTLPDDPAILQQMLRDVVHQHGALHAENDKLRLLIQGFVEDDKDHPLDPAYHLSADAISALVKGKADRFNILDMGGKITALSIGQPVHRPGVDEVSTNAYFIFGVTLTLIENLECPRGE